MSIILSPLEENGLDTPDNKGYELKYKIKNGPQSANCQVPIVRVYPTLRRSVASSALALLQPTTNLLRTINHDILGPRKPSNSPISRFYETAGSNSLRKRWCHPSDERGRQRQYFAGELLIAE